MGGSVKKSTLYLVALVLMLAAFVLGLVQVMSGEGWATAAVPGALAAVMFAMWTRARGSESARAAPEGS